jgi:hypothetical protein
LPRVNNFTLFCSVVFSLPRVNNFTLNNIERWRVLRLFNIKTLYRLYLLLRLYHEAFNNFIHCNYIHYHISVYFCIIMIILHYEK